MTTDTDTVSQAPPADTVKQTIVETIEAPRLTNIDGSDFVTFTESDSIYEKKIEEKNKESGMKIPLTTYRSSVDELVLELFLIANWIKAEDVANVIEKQIKKCIKTRTRFE